MWSRRYSGKQCPQNTTPIDIATELAEGDSNTNEGYIYFRRKKYKDETLASKEESEQSFETGTTCSLVTARSQYTSSYNPNVESYYELTSEECYSTLACSQCISELQSKDTFIGLSSDAFPTLKKPPSPYFSSEKLTSHCSPLDFQERLSSLYHFCNHSENLCSDDKSWNQTTDLAHFDKDTMLMDFHEPIQAHEQDEKNPEHINAEIESTLIAPITSTTNHMKQNLIQPQMKVKDLSKSDAVTFLTSKAYEMDSSLKYDSTAEEMKNSFQHNEFLISEPYKTKIRGKYNKHESKSNYRINNFGKTKIKINSEYKINEFDAKLQFEGVKNNDAQIAINISKSDISSNKKSKKEKQTQSLGEKNLNDRSASSLCSQLVVKPSFREITETSSAPLIEINDFIVRQGCKKLLPLLTCPPHVKAHTKIQTDSVNISELFETSSELGSKDSLDIKLKKSAAKTDLVSTRTEKSHNSRDATSDEINSIDSFDLESDRKKTFESEEFVLEDIKSDLITTNLSNVKLSSIHREDNLKLSKDEQSELISKEATSNLNVMRHSSESVLDSELLPLITNRSTNSSSQSHILYSGSNSSGVFYKYSCKSETIKQENIRYPPVVETTNVKQSLLNEINNKKPMCSSNDETSTNTSDDSTNTLEQNCTIRNRNVSPYRYTSMGSFQATKISGSRPVSAESTITPEKSQSSRKILHTSDIKVHSTVTNTASINEDLRANSDTSINPGNSDSKCKHNPQEFNCKTLPCRKITYIKRSISQSVIQHKKTLVSKRQFNNNKSFSKSNHTHTVLINRPTTKFIFRNTSTTVSKNASCDPIPINRHGSISVCELESEDTNKITKFKIDTHTNTPNFDSATSNECFTSNKSMTDDNEFSIYESKEELLHKKKSPHNVRQQKDHVTPPISKYQTGYQADGKRIDVVIVLEDCDNQHQENVKVQFLMNAIKAGLQLECVPGQMKIHEHLIFVKVHAPSNVLDHYAHLYNMNTYFMDRRIDVMKTNRRCMGKLERDWILLMRSSRSFNNIVSPVMLFYILNHSVTLGATAIKLVKDTNIPLPRLITYVILLIAEQLQLFLFCWYSDEVNVQSSKLIDGASNSKWYNLPRECRKDFLLLLLSLKRNIIMRAGPVFNINTATFVKVVKTTYSLFMIFYQRAG